MATTTRRLTYDDLRFIPQEREGDRQELIDGELIVTPAPIPRHQDVSDNLVFVLNLHVRAQNLGKMYAAPIDVRLTPDTVLSPDIIFIFRDRLHIVGPRTVDAAPDLVVEILSPRTRQRDLRVKRDLYARFGVQEYWIADPDARSLSILTLQRDRFEPAAVGEDGRLASRFFPDLKLDLDQIFELRW
jgi:Uma2 family endonuclease